MSTQQVLEIVKARGMSVILKDGQPVLRTNGKNDAATDRLFAVLKWHRDRIIELLKRT